MKHLIGLILVALCLSSCATIHANPLPAGAKVCSSDWDCERGQYCGFPHTPGWNYAQCVDGSNRKWDYPREAGKGTQL